MKLRKLEVLEIKMEDMLKHEQNTHTRFWAKHRLDSHQLEEPDWESANRLLQNCETFSWIPNSGACEVRSFILKSKY